MLARLYILAIIFTALIIQGCVALQPFPTAARAGDTISLAIGSLEGANKNNLIITFAPDSDPGTPVDLSPYIRSVFNIFPDKTSQVNLQDLNQIDSINSLTSWSAHSAWLTVAVIDLPEGLVVGPGTVTVTTGSDIVHVNNAKKVDDISIPIEILPQTETPASPDNFEYYASQFSSSTLGDLAQLEPSKQVVVRAPIASGLYNSGIHPHVGAAEYVFSVPMVKLNDPSIVPPSTALMVVREENYYDYAQSAAYDGSDNNIAAQTQMTWFKNGDDLTVMFISPTNQLRDQLIRFSIIPYTAMQYDFAQMPTLKTYRYFDQNGNEISGMAPILVPVNF